jgi:hypothetical protein
VKKRKRCSKMPKHWSKILKNKDYNASGSEVVNNIAALEEFNELVKNNESFRNLLDEKEKLENNLKQLTGKNKPVTENDIRYQNEIPSISRKKKEELKRQQKNKELFTKLQNAKHAFSKWIKTRENLKDMLSKRKEVQSKYLKKDDEYTPDRERLKKHFDYNQSGLNFIKKRNEPDKFFTRKVRPEAESLKAAKNSKLSDVFPGTRNKKIDKISTDNYADKIKKIKKESSFKTFRDNVVKIKAKIPVGLMKTKNKVKSKSDIKQKMFSKWSNEKVKDTFQHNKKEQDDFESRFEKVRKKLKEQAAYENNTERILKAKVKITEPIRREKEVVQKLKKIRDDFGFRMRNKSRDKFEIEIPEIKSRKDEEDAIKNRERKIIEKIEEEKLAQKDEKRKEQRKQELIEQRRAERRSEKIKEQEKFI